MRILWYFHAYTQGQAHPVTIWAEAATQMAARNAIMAENPFVIRLQFLRTKRIDG